MSSTTFILITLAICANVHFLYGAPFTKYKATCIYKCPVPVGRCIFQVEDSCISNDECLWGQGCCPDVCPTFKKCERLILTNPTTPAPTTTAVTTTEVLTTKEAVSSTTDLLIATEETTTNVVPTTTAVPSTTKVPTTTAKPATTTLGIPTPEEVSSTTDEQEHTTKMLLITTKVPTVIALPTTSEEITTTEISTTTKVLTTQIATQQPAITTPVPTTAQKLTTTTKTTTYSVCGLSEQKDILFLVDGTANQQQDWTEMKKQFEEIKTFLKQVISELKQDKFRVGVMQFGGRSEPKMDIKFADSTNMDEVLSFLNLMKQRGGRDRNTGQALAAANNKLYEMNTIYDRVSVDDLIVLITRGRPWDSKQTESELEALKARRVRLITVGVGHPKDMENYLKRMVFLKQDLYLAKYKHLQNKGKDVLKGICSYVRLPSIKSPCANKQYDLYFLIDGSASINFKIFEKKRKFVSDLLVFLDSSSTSNINTGLMQFSEESKTKQYLALDRHPLKTELDVAQNLRYQSGKRTMLGNALSKVNNEVFTGQGGDRDDVPNVLIVFSDGRAHDRRQALNQAQSIKNKGTRVITITAAANAMIHDLRKMASEPKYSLRMNSKLEDAADYARKVSLLICQPDKN